jgi:hypothetical protein
MILRILPEPVDGWSPPVSIFGTEPEHGWCYYFEVAGLTCKSQDLGLESHLMQEAAR